MKKSAIYLVAVLVFLFGIIPSSHAALKKLGQTGLPFLKIEADGRTAAMGGANAGLCDDAASMFGNLAGLAFVEGWNLTLNQTNWLLDTKHYATGIAYGLGKWGTFGASIVYMDYGSFIETWPYEGTDPSMTNLGFEIGQEFDVAEYAIGISYARNISSQFAIGGQVKYAKQDLFESLMWHEAQGKELTVQNEVSVMAFDFGTIYYTGFKDLRIAMSIRNFSRQARYVRQRFELPLNFTIGVAMNIMTLFGSEDPNNRLTLAIDALHPRDYTERIHLGAEYMFMDLLALRGGYKFNYDEEGIAGGLGIKKWFGNFGVKFDYSYSAFGEFFDAVHRMSWGIMLK